jgi:hypothetical protein
MRKASGAFRPDWGRSSPHETLAVRRNENMAFAFRLVLLSQLAAAAILLCQPADADETGLADIHAQRREHGRTCMSEHFHYGSGRASSKGAALRAAVATWTNFTVFEYGSDWGSFSRAGSRARNCTDEGKLWSCRVQARPCKGRR